MIGILLNFAAVICIIISLCEWNKCRKDPYNQSIKPAIYTIVGIVLLGVSFFV